MRRGGSRPLPHAEVHEEREVRGPVVFQCGGCRSVIGDSFSLNVALKELDIVVLNNVVQAHQTGRSEPDAYGSQFQRISCSTCAKCIGRRYSHHHSEEYQHIVGYYALDIQAIQSYELGSGETMAGEDSSTAHHPPPLGAGAEAPIDADMLEDLVAELTQLKKDVGKMKAMALFHDERLEDLEKACAIGASGKGGDAGGGRSGGKGAGESKRKRR